MSAQLYGMLVDDTPGPLMEPSATSALLGLAGRTLPFVMQGKDVEKPTFRLIGALATF
jgi:hypothetical protein